MSLTAEQFAAVVGSLDGRAVLPGHEKRRAGRVVYRSRAQITPDGGKPVMTTIRDISSRGIGLLHGGDLPAGSQFVLHLPRGKQVPAALLCTVAYCRRLSASLFTVGAELTCVLQTTTPVPPRRTIGTVSDDAASKELERIRNSILA